MLAQAIYMALTLRLTRKALEVVERGAVQVKNVVFEGTSLEEQTTVKVEYTNIGNTPVKLLRAAVLFEKDEDLPTVPEYGNHDVHMPMNIGVFPKDELKVTFSLSLTSGEVQEIREGRRFLYVLGVFYYSDAFGTQHYTRFARLWDTRSQRFMFVLREGYNDTE